MTADKLRFYFAPSLVCALPGAEPDEEKAVKMVREAYAAQRAINVEVSN